MRLIEAKNVVPGVEIDATNSMYPTRMLVAGGLDGYRERDHTRHTYGYVLKGSAWVDCDLQNFILIEGAYFALPGRFSLTDLLAHETAGAEHSVIVLIQRLGYRGLMNIGRLEEKGRLSYIDGCSDTLLVPPARLGEPCLNYLYFPRGVLQTQHTHPSIRMGIVTGGLGFAWQQQDQFGAGWELPLEKGNIFMLEESELHSFKTTTGWLLGPDGEIIPGGREAQTMSIVAFHPDSDTGPTDNDNPMLNRTFINHGQPGGQSGARP